MSREILSVGFMFPGDEVEYLSHTSDRSLLDADIIVFQPTIPYEYYSSPPEIYNGKPILSETGSFRARESVAHWRNELKTALDAGKSIFIFLSTPKEAFIYTGERQYSGTGRNRHTTRLVAPFSSYDVLPIKLGKVVSKKGSSIATTSDFGILAGYWKEFGQYSSFQIYIEEELQTVLMRTKTGGKVVGAMVREGKGTMFLLPPIKYNEEAFTFEQEDGEEYWTKEAESFGKRLVIALVEIDKVLHATSTATPAPSWVANAAYKLHQESVIQNEISKIDSQIEDLHTRKAALLQGLEHEGSLRGLLYETGRKLENAIIEALRLLGFTAENYTDDTSEFDAVFISSEGRFLGEVEGKDNKAIAIDKLSQLERNLQEDFAREEVSEYAKGVLFGNAYRLTEVDARGPFFTDKCISGAQRLKVALIRTPDLFRVAKLMKEQNNSEFAKQCREAIMQAEGEIVQFPQEY